MKQHIRRVRGFAVIAAVALAASALGIASVGAADAITPPDPNEIQTGNITICHRTNSNKNPYVVNSPNVAGVLDGHYAQHQGPLWDETLKAQKIKWGDIIPPFKYDGGTFPGYNWSEGEAWYRAGCVAPPPKVQTFGSISVTKTVVLPTGTPTATLPASFTVHVSCDDEVTLSQDLTFPLTEGTSAPQVIGDIETGSQCVVTEKDTTGFPEGTVVTITPSGTFTVEKDTTAEVNVKNDFSLVRTQVVDVVKAAPTFTG